MGGGAVGTPGSPALMDQGAVLNQLQRLQTPDVVGAAPFLYIVARNQDTPVVVAGTWLDQLPKLDPTWKIDGQWIASREDDAQCIVGRNAARQFHFSPGDKITLNYLGRSASFEIAGVVDAGAAADNQVFVSLLAAQQLAATSGQIELVQMSVSGTAASIGAYAAKLASSLPGYDVTSHPAGDGSGGQSAAAHAVADRVDGGADSGADGAVRVGDDGRARDGAARRRGLDEGARRIDGAHRGIVSRRSGSARRGRRTGRQHRGNRAGALDGRARIRHVHCSALGSFPADNCDDDDCVDGRSACRCARWER